MSRDKNLRSVAASLSPMAQALPTQNVAASSEAKGQGRAVPTEPVVQFTFDLRKSLRKELARKADDADMTMRAFILDALREKGLSVTDEDLLDLRKRG
ncbi:MAG: hypothetical protein D6773_06875 [Alphaproteobacteria bacterium]|nr:MAG: hypothetical protein D6773_06875 [Alphaproteobacteria bacterium]